MWTEAGSGLAIPATEVANVANLTTYTDEQVAHYVSLVKAKTVDRDGNLRFARTARNFNPEIAMAGKLTIVEAEKLVDSGSIDPDDVHLSGIFVDRIVIVPDPEKRVERLAVRSRAKAEN